MEYKAVRTRDIEQFHLKGTILPDSLTIHELMHKHFPALGAWGRGEADGVS